jgi:adenine deaminase-like protein
MLKVIDCIEKIIVKALIVFMLLAITLGTLELGRVLIVEMLSPPFLLLDLESLFEAFGLVVVQDGAVVSRLALPFGGLMSTAGISQVEKSLRDLHQASQAVGCELPEPFLQLAFLSLPVIPSLKLTDKGLVDVHQFKIIDVRAA